MSDIGVISRFLKSSAAIDRAAREIFERLPLSVRYRLYYGKTFLYWSAFLRESEYWSKEKLETFQIEQLKSLLIHAGENVPYYKELFSDYGFNPRKMQSINDIKSLPYLTKETVRDRADEFIAGNFRREKLTKRTTGGSTGIPLVIYSTDEIICLSHAFLLNLLGRVGYNPKMRIVFFQWKDIGLGKKRGLDFLRYGNKLILSSVNAGDAWMFKYYEMIGRFKPDFISGYKTALLSFSNFIRERELTPFDGVKAAFAYAETIPQWQRKIIEESLGARVFPTYGMYENVVFGGGCEHSNQYHLYPQRGIVEFIDIRENAHELVGTGFFNHAMPFIRYRTMDIGAKGAQGCEKCGRNYPLLERIDGRMNEFLIAKGGRIFYTAMTGVGSDVFRNVKQFQFYQDEPGIAYLRIIKGKQYSDNDTARIGDEISRRFNLPEINLEIRIVFVDALEGALSGKVLMTDQRLDIRKFIRS